MRYMKYVKRNVLIATITMLSLAMSCVSVIAEPVVESIITDPEAPTRFSTITVTAIISGNDITNVVLIAGECSDVEGVCFIYHQIPMTEITPDRYTSEVTLEKSKTTYISYSFDITHDGNTTRFQNVGRVDLSIDSGNGDNSDTTNDDESDDIPGFEIITLLAAIILGTLFIKRKRF